LRRASSRRRSARAGKARVHVSTAARLKAAAYDAARKIVSCELEYPKNEASYLVVAGIAPKAVRSDGNALPQVNDLDAANEGWKVNTDGLLLVKVKHAQQTLRLEMASR